MRFITDFKSELIRNLEGTKRKIVIITGYITIEGFEFLESFLIGKTLEKIIVFKLDLIDFKNGASSFNYKKALDNGWKVYVNKTIHAKNYVFDDEFIIQGSSNLTSNGIGLHHDRQDDNNVLWEYTSDFRAWVEEKISTSILIHNENAVKTDDYVQKAILETDFLKIKDYQNRLERRLSKLDLELSSQVMNQEDIPIIGKIVSRFIGAFKSNPDYCALPIDRVDLDNYYRYSEHLSWYNDYVIHLDQPVNINCFHFNNEHYRYTPRMYSLHNKLYLEKLYGKHLDYSDRNSVQLLLSTLKEVNKIGIVANCQVDEVFSYMNRIRFKKFYPGKGLNNDEIEAHYKDELIKLTGDENIKALVKDFRL